MAVVRIIVAINSELLSDHCGHIIENVCTVLDISGICDVCGGMACFIRSIETTHRALSQGFSLGSFQA